MLSCANEQRLFSSYAGNVYEVQGRAERSESGRKCNIQYLEDHEPYQLNIVDYYINPENSCSVWLKENFEECFGGRVTEGIFLWPFDYINEQEKAQESSSIGLIFSKKQFDGTVKAEKVLNEKNVVGLLLPVFRMLEELHKSKIALNGMDLQQLLYSMEERKVLVPVLHNCIYERGITAQTRLHISDDAKFLYQEKVFSIPLGSCWRNLPLFQYAYCNDIYSLATILFYVLVGRHPLDGRMCDDQETIDGRKEIYNQSPCFIFHKKDDRNRIGELEGEDETIRRWENLDSSLKDLFLQLYDFPKLNNDEMEKKIEKMSCFNLGDWIKALEERAGKRNEQ